jgi:esterase/lipase superfamily enzyme
MKAKVLIFAAFLLASVSGMAEVSRGQTPAVEIETSTAFDSIVKDSLLSLIKELQKEIDRQAAGQRANFQRGQIDPTLKILARPIQVQLSKPVRIGVLYSFNAHVVHENGASAWTLKVSPDTGQITNYTFVISKVGPDPTLKAEEARRTPEVAARPAPKAEAERNAKAGETEARPKKASPPTVTAAPSAPTSVGSPASDPRIVEFLFASTRKTVATAATPNISYSGERGPLTYGAASVRIPEDHKIGHIELPSSMKLFGIKLSPNEREHFIIKSVVSLPEYEFDQIIREKNAKSALVFVHGFNTTFEDALYRNAQIVWDLQYNGLSVLFTWASRGDVSDYIYDKESAYQARDDFITLLRKLKQNFGIEQVNVLAHSMGNLIALEALAGYASTSNPVQIAHLVMAAPDVDRDEFVKLTPKAKTIVGGMTLYASSADRALVASRKLAGGIPRAGDVSSDGPIILPNVETIDVTAVGDEIFGLNHNVFAASRDVMEDISALLNLNRPPPRLIQIRAAPDPPAHPTYWRYVR